MSTGGSILVSADETEEELVEHFQRWAKNPKVRAWICGDCASQQEQERRLREIFGLNSTETVHQAETGAAGAASGSTISTS